MNDFSDNRNEAIAHIRESIKANRLAHAYLVHGPPRTIGLHTAIAMLSMLFCEKGFGESCGVCRNCKRVSQRLHPDVHWVEPEKKSRIIGVDQVRKTLPLIHHTSLEGGWKACVFIYADRLNTESANAFLKSLEEPPDKSIILLLTDTPQAMLPTILSRCQVLRAQAGEGLTMAPWADELLNILATRKQDGLTPVMRTAQCEALLEAIEESVVEQVEEEYAHIQEDVDKDIQAARISSLVKEQRAEMMNILLKWQRDVLICTSGAGESMLHFPHYIEYLKSQSESLDTAGALKRVEEVEKMNAMLNRNISNQLVFARGFRELI
jgi:DNA polymerase-3 subunit delta'